MFVVILAIEQNCPQENNRNRTIIMAKIIPKYGYILKMTTGMNE